MYLSGLINESNLYILLWNVVQNVILSGKLSHGKLGQHVCYNHFYVLPFFNFLAKHRSMDSLV